MRAIWCGESAGMFRHRYRLAECMDCGMECVLRRRVPRHELHLVLTIGTLGLWAPCWLITLFAARWEPWRCTDCRRPQAEGLEEEETVHSAQCIVRAPSRRELRTVH